MVLTAVAFAALAAHSLKQTAAEHRQMTDIIAAQKIIRRIIGLKMAHHGPVDPLFEQCLIAVQKIRTGAQNAFPHSENSVRSQDIIVVGQGQIFPRSQGCSGVGVGADAFVFNFAIMNAPVLCGQLLQILPHLRMLCIAGIRRAQLPPGAGLVEQALHKITQKLFGCVVKRNTHADNGEFSGILCALGSQGAFIRQITRPLAKEAALKKARAAPKHGADAVFSCQRKGIAKKFFYASDPLIHTLLPPGFRPALSAGRSFQIYC